jgi:pimeloyl-ACP methyl ester carboxylesterase
MAALTLSHQRIGEGPPLIVLHGLFGSSTNWRGVARALADCRSVHLLDARNHGASPHAAQMDYALQAGDVAAYMDSAGIASADVIGHSMGGKTAMRLALDAPARVSRLMVVDIAPAPSDSDHRPLIEAMLAMPVQRYARRAEADAALAASVADPALRAFLLQNLTARGTGMGWRIDLGAIRDSMPALLGFEAAPGARYLGAVLFVRGARSHYLRAEHEPAIRAHFPAARIATIDGAGHWVHAEQPQRFVALAREYLGCAAS